MSDVSWVGIGASGAAAGAFITGIFAWLVQRHKGGTAVEVAVLAEWQKLNGALSDRLSSLAKEFAEYRIRVSGDFESLRRKHNEEIDEMRRTHRAEMKAMRELNEGLQRQILQNSQSTAQMLSDRPDTRAKSDDRDGE